MVRSEAVAARVADDGQLREVTMPADAKTPGGFSLRRWSRRKLEVARETAPVDTPPRATPVAAVDGGVPEIAISTVRPAAPVDPLTLPPVETLAADADFTAYLQPNVDEAVRRQALKRIFADPRFNVMDGLDVYIDDYTKTVPIPPELLERLMKSAFAFNPPQAPGNAPPESPPAPAVAADPAAPVVAVDSTAPNLPTPVATASAPDAPDSGSAAPDGEVGTPAR
jgi:hypothetical protein